MIKITLWIRSIDLIVWVINEGHSLPRVVEGYQSRDIFKIKISSLSKSVFSLGHKLLRLVKEKLNEMLGILLHGMSN